MVSIILPCYNGAKFIKRCFDSILNQTYKDLEIILVNDGSTDNSEEIVESMKYLFEEQNIRFIYIYQKNGGLSAAINTGLKYVTGEYLTLLDIDDYIMPESIELKVQFLESNKSFDIVRTNGYYVNEHNLDDTSRLFINNDNEKCKIDIFDDLVEAKTNNWAGSYMVRTSKLFDFYKDRKIYESRYGQNLQILMPLAYNGKCGYIDKPLMKYIRQESSLSQTKNLEVEIKNYQGYKDIRLYMIDLIVKEYEKEKYNKCVNMLYARTFMNLAIQYGNKNVLEENYNILKENQSLTIEDKIAYYNQKNKLIVIIYRILRKISF
jgi:glycosyltransferase involved in cell wall biosynthesis